MNETKAEFSTHAARPDPRNDRLKLFVNGRIVPKEEAVVSVYDSGFMLGDGIWEGLRLHNGRFAFLEEHLKRLYDSARAIDLDIGMSPGDMAGALYATARANDMFENVHARLMVTRGVKSKPFQDPRLSLSGSTVVIITEFSTPSEDAIERGIRLHTVPVYRGLPVTQDPKLNSHSKLNCILAGIHAQKAGADEALMLDPHGFVNTTNSCNFFIVRGGEVWTSSGDFCMNGITRHKVILLCKENDIPVFQRNFGFVETYACDEAFITGTFGAQTPVFEIDGREIGDGRAGPVTHRLRDLYKTMIAKDCAISEI